jgi:hypothetical protein
LTLSCNKNASYSFYIATGRAGDMHAE